MGRQAQYPQFQQYIENVARLRLERIDLPAGVAPTPNDEHHAIKRKLKKRNHDKAVAEAEAEAKAAGKESAAAHALHSAEEAIGGAVTGAMHFMRRASCSPAEHNGAHGLLSRRGSSAAKGAALKAAAGASGSSGSEIPSAAVSMSETGLRPATAESAMQPALDA